MPPRRVDVFFYGLFMDSNLLRTKNVSPTNIRSASVPGFTLRIGQRATLIRSEGARAYGMLMELTHAEIDALYSEPSVSAYRPEGVIAELANGTAIPALCFNIVVPPESTEPDADYAAKLRALAHNVDLPSDYVDSIR